MIAAAAAERHCWNPGNHEGPGVGFSVSAQRSANGARSAGAVGRFATVRNGSRTVSTSPPSSGRPQRVRGKCECANVMGAECRWRIPIRRPHCADKTVVVIIMQSVLWLCFSFLSSKQSTVYHYSQITRIKGHRPSRFILQESLCF